MGGEKTKVLPKWGLLPMVFDFESVQKLDKLGTSTSSDFRQVKWEEVERYLDWDLNHNTLVVMHQLILRQCGKGIAIGGYLSSWAAELWCLWKEHMVISEVGHKETIAGWLEELEIDKEKNEDLKLSVVKPTLSLAHPVPFVPS